MKRLLPKISIVLCYFLAVAFSLKKLREPDLWWQIRTGQWILEHHRVPAQDVFSYTFAGTKWINIKWGFELLAAIVAAVAGPESIFLLQVLTSCLLVFFLFRAARLFSVGKDVSLQNIAFIAAMVLTLVAIEYRLIGRPEMISHLLALIFIYILLKHRQAPSKWLYLLVPLQLLWANMHEAFAIGLIIIAIFTAGAWLEYLLPKKFAAPEKAPIPGQITTVLLAATATVLINPSGAGLLLRPINILGQVYANKFTLELAGFRSHNFWHWNTYLGLAMLFASLAGTIVYFGWFKSDTPRLKLFLKQFGIAYPILLLAFVYLASTAYRNLVFLELALFPLLAFSLQAVLIKLPRFQKHAASVFAILCMFQVTLYVAIVSDKYYAVTQSHDLYGLETLATNNPTGAAEFVQRSSLKGRCFSDYLTSSYLLWKLQPEFKTFIDLRDLDIFPSDFFSTFAVAVSYPEEFRRQDSIFHFSYVVLYRPQFEILHNYLFNQSRFKLVYLDQVAAVYVPGKDTDQMPIAFSKPKAIRSNAISFFLSKLFNPFYRPYDYRQADYDAIAASYCISVDRLDEAEQFAAKACNNNIENYKGYKLMGDVYYERAMNRQEQDSQNVYLNKSLDYFGRALKLSEDDGDALQGQGAVYFQQKNLQKALYCFEQALAADGNNINACLSAAACCAYLMNNDAAGSDGYTRKAIELYRKASQLNPDNPVILMNLGLLYARIDNCGEAVKLLAPIAGFSGFSRQQQAQIRQSLEHCGK